MSETTKINPFSGSLQKFIAGISFKEGVADVGSLPSSGNSIYDARVVNDTHTLYIWNGSSWTSQGDIIDLTWSAISGKPSSSTVNIDDAVTKKHTQNTDTILDENGTNEISAENLVKGAIQFVINGGGSELTTGVKGDIEIPFPCTIEEVRLLADQSGSVQVDIWKDTYANYPPTDADSITASAVPAISSDTDSEDSTLTGWTTSVSEGDILRFNVDSVTTITRVTVVLKIKRT